MTVAGCRIHYLRWAREPARPGERGLLFVHGGGAHSHWWSNIAPYFTRDFRVAAIDLSGMGDSGWRTHYNSELRAEEIRTVMAAAQLGERPFVNGPLNSGARSFLHRESSLVDRHSLKASTNCVTILRKSWSCGVNLKGAQGKSQPLRFAPLQARPFKANDLTLSLHDYRVCGVLRNV